MTVQFFGARWDAPMVDTAVDVPTTVGVPCLDCHEPIAAGDRGLLVPVMAGPGVEWACRAVISPVHLECHLRSTMSHVYGQCGCFVLERSLREEALGVLGAVNVMRAEHGMGPL